MCDNVKIALLGRPAILTFNLVKIEIPEIASCAAVSDTQDKDNICKQYPSIFEGLGKISGKPIHIELHNNVVPYHIGAPRRVAIPYLEPLKAELERMQNMGVIRPVDQPTEWCHPIVIVHKPNGNLRICLD